MTAYNGTAITYDEIGNRLTDGTWTYTWEHGRELSSMTDGTNTWTYTYDANGLRTKRAGNTHTYEYIYDGNGKLVFMQYHHYKMYFTYDPLTGAPHSVYYDDGYYEQYTMYYITNTRGDVLGLALEDGTVVVSYDYDAWGNLVHYEDNTLWGTGDINPLRYRGYVYDRETGLYYLQSRYYDPEIGRFINADDYVATGQGLSGNNSFAYCGNNPIMYCDPTGHFGLAAAIITTGAIVGGVLGAFTAVTTGGNVLESVIEGCLTGAIGATCGILISNPIVAIGLATVGGSAVDFATQATTQYIDNKSIDLSKLDYGRVIKTGVQTGLGTAIPQYGNATNNAVDAFGTALIWAEGSALIAATDVAITNMIQADSSNARRSTKQYGAVFGRGYKMIA